MLVFDVLVVTFQHYTCPNPSPVLSIKIARTTGDSGGPLLWSEQKNPNSNDRPNVNASVVLTGIVSWGEVRHMYTLFACACMFVLVHHPL